LVAYVTAQRTKEIGIRMALGARCCDVQWMALGQRLRLATAGLVCGGLLSATLTGLLRRFLFGVSPMDSLTLAVSGLAWLLVSAAAAYLPARHAAEVDPLTALRYDG
jgi:putative ABC transport system permease protein